MFYALPVCPACHRYFWSLDTFTDFTWQDLTKLSIILVVLLVVEVRFD
jgi:hypothetical protein